MTDHALYPFEPLPRRPLAAWPHGARLAAFVVVYVEHWELTAPEGAHRDPRFVGEYGSFTPDYRTWTQREYGNRIGIFRVLDALDRAGIAPAIALSTEVIRRAPRLVALLSERRCEFIAHGPAATRMITSRMTEVEERALIVESIRSIERATGTRPIGWAGQDFGESPRTPQLLAEAGLSYVLDWPNDDLPYRLTTTPPMLSIPNQAEWDDVQLQWLRRVPVTRYPEIVQAAFTRLAAEGEGRVFGLGVHPWLAGMAARIRYLREALAGIRSQTGVWWTTPGEITRHCT